MFVQVFNGTSSDPPAWRWLRCSHRLSGWWLGLSGRAEFFLVKGLLERARSFCLRNFYCREQTLRLTKIIIIEANTPS